MDSILTSIKKHVGIEEDYTHFDPVIIEDINTVFGDLHQLGVGPTEGFYIEDKSSTWSDFVPDPGVLEGVRSYMKLRVRLLFDPPINSAVIASMEKQIEKLEWRLNVAAETKETES